MQLDLNRFTEIKDATIGILTIDGEFQCFTLEDVERRKKIAKVTAIPCGDYPVKLTPSNKFSAKYKSYGLSELVPLLTGVPNYEGIRIHMGKNARWSEGCILVGRWDTKHGAEISDSYEVYKALHERLSQATGEIRISVRSTTGKFEAKVAHPAPPLFKGLYHFQGLHHGANRCTVRPAAFEAENGPHMSVAGAGPAGWQPRGG
jgi:hypothetical protein